MNDDALEHIERSFPPHGPLLADRGGRQRRSEGRGKIGDDDMDFNFTGSLTQRNINLGSRSEVTSSQLAQHARDQRAARQELKRRQAAATRIQAAYRGSAAAGGVRDVVRRQAEASLGALEGEGEHGFEQVSRLVARATSRPRMVKQLVRAAGGRRATVRELQVLSRDDELLLAWAKNALRAGPDGSEWASYLFRPFVHVADRYGQLRKCSPRQILRQVHHRTLPSCGRFLGRFSSTSWCRTAPSRQPISPTWTSSRPSHQAIGAPGSQRLASTEL